MRFVVCVTGGRSFSDKGLVFATLDTVHAERRITQILEGGAEGADRWAREWSHSRGVPCRTFEAMWNLEGKAAGPLRNQRMFDDGKPDLCVLLPGGKGTADCARRARAAGVKILEVLPEEEPNWDSCARPHAPKDAS